MIGVQNERFIHYLHTHSRLLTTYTISSLKSHIGRKMGKDVKKIIDHAYDKKLH